MTVGERGGLAAEAERVAACEPGRRDAHDAAAALAVVDWLAGGAGVSGVQGAEACHAGSPLVLQELLAAQPSAVDGRPSVLSVQPALVCAPDRGGRVSHARWCLLVAEQTFGG